MKQRGFNKIKVLNPISLTEIESKSDKILAEIGFKIKTTRNLLKIRANKLCEITNIGNRILSKIENGKNISLVKVLKIEPKPI